MATTALPALILLTDLDEDALTAVLLGLPAPRRREWIFVALTCKALHAAVLRASVIDTAEEQRASGLPVGRNSAPVDVVLPTGYRFATSIPGMLTTPLRIVYSRECLRPHEALRCTGTLLETSVPARAREQFLRVLSHHFVQSPPPQSLERVRARRARAESLAAYRLTTRALYHMVHLAPLHTLRAAFFEVLGGNPHCALDLTLRHHRCLVFFAATHGRVDVLDRLVHRDPHRALAYDFERGLLPIFQEATETAWVVPTTSSATSADISGVDFRFGDPSPGRAERIAESQLLLARPAALHNQPGVLAWMDATQLALQRRTKTGGRFRVHSRTSTPLASLLRMRSFVKVGGLTLSVHASGVGANGLRVYGPPSIDSNRLARQDRDVLSWRALRLLVCEAGNGAALDVLDRLWTQVTDRIVHVGCRQPDQVQEECFHGAILWAILLVLLTKPRRGAVVAWMVRQCHRKHGVLRAIGMQVQRLRAMGALGGPGPLPPPHTWNPRIFDMEDLMQAALNMESPLVDHVMTAFDLTGQERLLRERIIGPGDAAKTEWLLNELTHTEACLLARARRGGLENADHPGMMATEHLSLTAGEDTYDPETGHGWLSRSLAGYIGEDGEGGGGGFFLRAELDPGRWSRTDSLCLHLSRQSFHFVGVHSTTAPLLFETPESVSGSFTQRTGPGCGFVDLPESYVFASQVGTCNTWVPEEGLLGFTRLQQGLATVLKHWLLHALDVEPVRCTERLEHCRYNYWLRAVREAPEACHAAIADVCTQLFCTSELPMRDDDDDRQADAYRGKAWMHERREILAALIEEPISEFCWSGLGQWDASVAKHPHPRMRWRCAWAVAYTELGAAHGLLVPGEERADGLLENARCIPPLYEAMRRALARDSHATGTLPPQRGAPTSSLTGT